MTKQALRGAIYTIKQFEQLYREEMSRKDGLTKLDVSVLTAEQQEKLREFKIKTRLDNDMYLRSHPEVEVLIGNFLRDVLLKRPSDICEFAADHFTNADLQLVNDSKMERNNDTK